MFGVIFGTTPTVMFAIHHSESMLIKIQPDATVCRYLFTAKLLYMFQVSQHLSSRVLKSITVQWINYPLHAFWYYHFLWKYIGTWIQKRLRTLATGWTRDQPVAWTSTWQHTTLTTDIHASGGIRTHNLTRPTAAGPRLRPRDYWDRQINLLRAGN